MLILWFLFYLLLFSKCSAGNGDPRSISRTYDQDKYGKSSYVPSRGKESEESTPETFTKSVKIIRFLGKSTPPTQASAQELLPSVPPTILSKANDRSSTPTQNSELPPYIPLLNSTSEASLPQRTPLTLARKPNKSENRVVSPIHFTPPDRTSSTLRRQRAPERTPLMWSRNSKKAEIRRLGSALRSSPQLQLLIPPPFLHQNTNFPESTIFMSSTQYPYASRNRYPSSNFAPWADTWSYGSLRRIPEPRNLVDLAWNTI